MKKKPISIRKKLVSSTIIFIFCIACVSLLVVYYWSFYHFSNIFEDRVIDEYTFQKKMDMGVENEWILGVTTDSIDVIRSIHGSEVADRLQDQAQKQEEISKLYQETIDDKHLLYVIRLDTQEGEMMYEYSIIKDIYAEVFPKILLSFIIFLLLLAGISIYYVHTISETLYSDIRNLRLYTKQIPKGQKINPITTKTQDKELKQLQLDLQQMQESLEKESALRQSALQYISHEMKTPLMIIEGYTTSAQDGIYPKGDLDSSFQTILTQTDRMKQKVSDLLTIVRLEASSVPDDTMEICLLQVIQHILQLFEQKNRQQTTYIHIPNQIFWIGSKEKLHILLENLISNQIKYAQSHFSISYQIENETLLLYFYNDGQTIPAEMQDDLFQPFVKGRNGGTGLGLSICHTILKQQGCDIYWKETRVGTLFVVSITAEHWKWSDIK